MMTFTPFYINGLARVRYFQSGVCILEYFIAKKKGTVDNFSGTTIIGLDSCGLWDTIRFDMYMTI